MAGRGAGAAAGRGAGWRRAGELALCALLQLARAGPAYAEGGEGPKSCEPDELLPCPGEQQCLVDVRLCACLAGLTVSGDDCVRIEPESDSHAGLAVAITLFTVVIIVAALALIVHRYKLVDYARRQWDVRRNRDVMYEDVMIGQDDDPPLTP